MYYTRRMPRLEYLAPKDLNEACSLLSEHKEEAKVLAGGTDLLPQIKKRDRKLRYLIGLKSIKGLDSIELTPDMGIRIGMLASLEDVAKSPVVQENCPVLSQAIGTMASLQVRNLGTVVGNLCHGSPSADTAPPLMALDASLKIVSIKGKRTVPLQEFFTGPSQTVIGDDEIVTEAVIPKMPDNSSCVYMKHTRRKAMDLAVVGVATLVVMAGSTCKDAKIVIGAAAPTPFRAIKAEEIVKGRSPEEEILNEAAVAASEESRPISDVRSSAEYRKEMVKVYTKRALMQAFDLAK